MLKEGINFNLTKIVNEDETAAKVASGALEVFSTPSLIAFMENTAFQCVQRFLDEGDTTVGISVNMKHLKASLVGDTVECEAKLVKIEGKKLFFDITSTSNGEIIGTAEHIRYIVNQEKFLSKLNG